MKSIQVLKNYMCFKIPFVYNFIVYLRSMCKAMKTSKKLLLFHFLQFLLIIKNFESIYLNLTFLDIEVLFSSKVI